MQASPHPQLDRNYRFPQIACFKDIEEDFPLLLDFLDFICVFHPVLDLNADQRRRLALEFFNINPDQLAAEEEELQQIVDAL